MICDTNLVPRVVQQTYFCRNLEDRIVTQVVVDFLIIQYRVRLRNVMEGNDGVYLKCGNKKSRLTKLECEL